MIRAPQPRKPSIRSIARQRVVSDEGNIYAAQSNDGVWMKIGFSQQVDDRIRSLNAEYSGYAVFTLVATTRGMFRTEQQMHTFMRPLHQVQIKAGKEFYPVMPAVLDVVKELIEAPDRLEIDSEWYLHLLRWGNAAAKEDRNRLPALAAHHEIVASNAAAEARTLARHQERMREREAARALRRAADTQQVTA